MLLFMWSNNVIKSTKQKFKNKNICNPNKICSEARTLTSRNEQQLRIFEQKILRKIFDPVQDENGIWRIRKNHELNELIGNADMVRFIKSRKWPD